MDYPVKTTLQLGMILQALRKERNRTQRELAEASGLLQKSVSLLERSPERATVRTLFSLLTALDAEVVIRSRKGNGADGFRPADSEEW